AHVHVEDAPAEIRGIEELAVSVGGLGEAHQARLRTLRSLVDGHAPAGIVILRLADHRVVSLQQFVPDRNRLRGDAAEHSAHTARNATRPDVPLAWGRTCAAGPFPSH